MTDRARALLAVDTGGTFTDLVWWERGAARVTKVLSTPDDPGRAILEGLARLRERSQLPDEALTQVLHGSTVATNAVLERRGARTAFVTNAGFEDLLTIGRQNRSGLYALRVTRPPPLVASEDCHGVGGRLGPDGVVWEPLDEPALSGLIEALAASPGVRAVAVCLLHSYANAAHEERVAAVLRAARPDLEVSVSSAILPRFREYERACATVLNAYVQPMMRRYLSRLREQLGAELLVVQSDGGLVSASEAAERPVHTLLSGPAGGVIGAWTAGRSAQMDRLIAFDMGGTSTDVSLIDGQPTLTGESEIGGLPLAVTTVAIHTVGAGGGSIAWVDAAGALKVGPQSAGADPGPACYGRGRLPTVTDAHVLLGRLPARAFLGGEMTLDGEAAAQAIGALAESLELPAERAAQGIIAVANAHMVRAIKVISLERGHDPRDFCLVGFGGAGGLHAAELAEALGMRRVLMPANPGLLSAAGMLQADVTREIAQTVLRTFPTGQRPSPVEVAGVVEPLRDEATAFFDQHGVAEGDRHLEVAFDCRYRGQSFELSVTADLDDDFIDRFHDRHEWRYGYRLDRPVEWVAVRLRARGRRWHESALDWVAPPVAEAAEEAGAPWPIRSRSALPLGAALLGPAVITEYSGTTWVPEGWAACALDDGALLLTREAP